MKAEKNRAVTGSGTNLGGRQTAEQQEAARRLLQNVIDRQNRELRQKRQAREIDRYTGAVIPKHGPIL